ncbi:ribosome biogenesis GTP-binding protein YihA/YsxC [uncultured Oscillibacter sp.]|uniref:ribosome biogenesis GTP-binding protein YihA/YsxC n=1 Tax=uncultured Oscillibacter sp. TaxID=876091 RepID=UPI00261B26F0|nr:ribosome biogenesis GTP-binding protein YihA/YsxC [uncultured Oscillibacter sp.]
MPLNFGKAEFVRSAAGAEQFFWDGLPQFAFAGRSNVGKSSVINRLVGRKNLAYVGSSPGKTTQINYFSVDRRAYLVDLPGYGYAKVSRAEKERWGRLMECYFQEARMTAGVLIVDIRHKPTADDVTMHSWFRETGCPELIVANKLDKLKRSQVEPALALIRGTLELGEGDVLLPFSAEKGTGKEELIGLLNAACES